jgi:hypothetical protein
MAATYLVAFLLAAASGAQQSVTLNVPGTPDGAPTVLTGCLMPAGGTTNMPGGGGSSGTGPAGMNADAANTGVFFTINLGKKRKSKAGTSYALDGVDTTELKKLANSRVEVHGVLEPAAAQAGTGGDVVMSNGKKKASKSPSRFRVTAIKQVPGSCGGQ